MEFRSKIWHVWHRHLHIRKVKEKGYVPRGSGGDVMWYNVTEWVWFAGNRVFFRDVDVMDQREERQGDLGIGLWHEVLFTHVFWKVMCFHDFHEFHDFMIYESYDSWDEYNINYYLYFYTYTQMWCECGVLCATMSRPGPWLRFGRDAGAGAKLSPVSPWSPVLCFSHSTSEI